MKQERSVTAAYRIICQNAKALSLAQRFGAATESSVKLAVALYGYFHAESLHPAQREVFGKYICDNIRTATHTMVELGWTQALEECCQNRWLDEQLVTELLQIAITRREAACITWLLRLKQKLGGFQDRDFTF